MSLRSWLTLESEWDTWPGPGKAQSVAVGEAASLQTCHLWLGLITCHCPTGTALERAGTHVFQPGSVLYGCGQVTAPYWASESLSIIVLL